MIIEKILMEIAIFHDGIFADELYNIEIKDGALRSEKAYVHLTIA